MEKIIKKAIEGGYTLPYHTETEVQNMAMVLDKDFWQVFGKAEGWEPWVQTRNGVKVAKLQEYEYRKRREELGVSKIGDPLIKYVPTYIFYGSLFHEINLTEGWDKAVVWLEDLLAK